MPRMATSHKAGVTFAGNRSHVNGQGQQHDRSRERKDPGKFLPIQPRCQPMLANHAVVRSTQLVPRRFARPELERTPAYLCVAIPTLWPWIMGKCTVVGITIA